MKRFRLVFLFIATCFAAIAQPATAAVHPLMLYGGADRMWLAQVSNIKTGSDTSERTDIYVRQSGVKEPWMSFATLPARVTMLACRQNQLAVLLSSGQWMLVWNIDNVASSSSGEPLPDSAQIRALADDGQSLWAVGMEGAGKSTTMPASATPAAFLFHQLLGKWENVAQLPDEAATAVAGEMSLTIAGGRPTVAFRVSGWAVCTVQLRADGHWLNLGVIAPPAQVSNVDFHLLALGNTADLWLTDETGNAWLYDGASATRQAAALNWKELSDSTVPPAIAPAANGTILMAGQRGTKLLQRQFRLDGTPATPITDLVLPVDLTDSPIQKWMDGALLAALGFSLLATAYRRWHPELTQAVTPPPPAPLLPRLFAGLIDLLPVILASFYLASTTESMADPLRNITDPHAVLVYCIGVVIYLLHTTICEILLGQTLGKWLFGLVAVTVSGGKPTAGQFFVRNVLRVIDLLFFPLVLVPISPLRQRSADVAAGTMVVKKADLPVNPPAPQGQTPQT